jgi:uncharacterized membrane protein
MSAYPPMIKPNRSVWILPILLTAFGIGWLLKITEVSPTVDWLWTMSLACIGTLIPIVIGLDKVTVVIGPAFLIACCLSLLCQTEKLSTEYIFPIMLIAIGLLLAMARLPTIPKANWLVGSDDHRS